MSRLPTASRSLQPFLDGSIVCPTHTQADRHTDHATCDICSKRPHRIYALRAGDAA